jgi:hypothetical protein
MPGSGVTGGAAARPPRAGDPLTEAVLRVQRQIGNAAATLVVQRGWTQEQTDAVTAQMRGEDWNRPGGPWWLLNGHNPEGIVAILRRMKGDRRRLADHPVDGSKYDKPRLDLAMSVAARGGTSADEVSGMDAIRNVMAGLITFPECWDVLRRLTSPARVSLYRRMSAPELQSLLRHVDQAPTPARLALEHELVPLVGPPLADLLLEFVPDTKGVVEGGVLQPMGEIRVLLKGTPVKVVPARGGPPESRPDRENPGHTFGPTTPGTFTLGEGGAFETASWKFSQVANGTAVRDTGTDIQVQRGGAWLSVRRLKVPLTRAEVMRRTTAVLAARDRADGVLTAAQADAEIRGAATTGRFRPLPAEWIINDFGKVGFRLQGTAGDIIHATPETDNADTAVTEGDLTLSHGCIHILPDDRKDLIEHGFLRGGVKIRVHPYDPGRLSRWGRPPP